VLVENVLLLGRVRCGRVSVGTCSVRFSYCRDVFGVVGLMPGRVRRGGVSVGT